MALSVGRRKSTVSISGTSTPSLKMSTEKTADKVPSRSSFRDLQPLVHRCIGVHCGRGTPRSLNDSRHVGSVSFRNAEAERSHAVRIRDLGIDLLQHQACPRVVPRVDAVESCNVIAPPLPRDCAEVRCVRDSEVVERAEELLFQGFPDAQLRSEVAVEPSGDVLAVCPLRRRREAEENARCQVLEEPLIAGRFSMMKLVDDDDIEVITSKLLDLIAMKRLDRSEHMSPPIGTLAGDVQLTERRIAEGDSERREALVEDLLAVRDEQQRGIATELTAQSVVVERCDDRLAGAGCGNDQIAPAPVNLAFRGELVEDLLLERTGLEIELREHELLGQARRAQSVIEAFTITRRFVPFEGVISPVALERGPRTCRGPRRFRRGRPERSTRGPR